MKKIAINGFGRIGRTFFRLAFDEPEIEVVAINDLMSSENLAYLLKYDSVYGPYQKEIGLRPADDFKFSANASGWLKVADKEILLLKEKEPKNLPWGHLGIEVVIEATGVFADYSLAKNHLLAGAKKVIITAPAKGKEGEEGRTVLLGINEKEAANFEVISNGSCTTNAAAPVLAVLVEKIGVKKAVLKTVHAYTNSQSLVDSPADKDFNRGRAGALNLSPSTTGAATTVSKVLKSLESKFDGLAVRSPVICGSLLDITFISERPTSVEEINQTLILASQEERFKNILAVSKTPLVSTDIIGDPRPAIVDLSFTKVIDNDLVKVLVWYDNEWAYSWTLLEQIKRLK